MSCKIMWLRCRPQVMVIFCLSGPSSWIGKLCFRRISAMLALSSGASLFSPFCTSFASLPDFSALPEDSLFWFSSALLALACFFFGLLALLGTCLALGPMTSEAAT